MNGPAGARALGLTEAQWKASRPALSHANAIVVAVWNFCGGWNPQLLDTAFAYFEVNDAEFVIDQLLAMKMKFDTHQAAQLAAAEKKRGGRGH